MAAKVFFKFQPAVKPSARAKAIALLRAHGAKNVRRLFPGREMDALARLYVASGDDPSTARKLVRLLNSRTEIEYAHGEAVRRPLTGRRRPGGE